LPRFAFPHPRSYLYAMPLLTPIERVTLELIRNTGVASRERLAWAKGKGYAEAVSVSRHRLTGAGRGALASANRADRR
jgi:hypothetical protein